MEPRSTAKSGCRGHAIAGVTATVWFALACVLLPGFTADGRPIAFVGALALYAVLSSQGLRGWKGVVLCLAVLVLALFLWPVY